VYVASGCDPCSEVGAWIRARHPINLTVCAAEEHPTPLRRLRYESAVTAVDGVRALGHTLTHLNLAFAVCGWVIATPGISHVLQLLVDASGGAARDITPT
jgi:hypothetical protein